MLDKLCLKQQAMSRLHLLLELCVSDCSNRETEIFQMTLAIYRMEQHPEPLKAASRPRLDRQLLRLRLPSLPQLQVS